MTTQICDTILYNGKNRGLHSYPLDDLFKAGFLRPYSLLRPGVTWTACHRGYVASWEIKEQTLFLIAIDGPWPLDAPFEAFTELFDQHGNIRPLCPDCRRPSPKHSEGQEKFVLYCPHCGTRQSLRKCPDCESRFSPVEKYCSKCGFLLEAWRCSHCGKETVEWLEKHPPLPPRGAFCTRCGNKIMNDSEVEAVEAFYWLANALHEGKSAEESAADKTKAARKKRTQAIPPVKAEWYTGLLIIPKGDRVESRTYEKDILLHVKEGEVFRKEIRNNLTLKFLADLWVRFGGSPHAGNRFWRLMEKSPHWKTGDEYWRSQKMPPPQLKDAVAETKAERKRLTENLRQHPLFMRARAD